MLHISRIMAAGLLLISACNALPETSVDHRFVTVKSGQFLLGERPYYFIGTNLWYGMNLGASGNEEGRGRLVRELDALAAMGINNLRVMAGSEGPQGEPWRVHPAMQSEPGVYDKSLLEGLDFLLDEMGKRDMKAVLVLSNFFQWTGGFAQYVSWADSSAIPYPNSGQHSWDEFQLYAASFYRNDKARQYFSDFVSMLTRRTNSVSGIAYRNDPTIMAWQLANEPRGFDGGKDYVNWIRETAKSIHHNAPNHLVSIGGEGKLAPHNNMRFEEISSLPEIDYMTMHLWVENWSWFDPRNPSETFDASIGKSMGYIADHVAIANVLNKPIVLEEFGMSRDGGSHEPFAATTWRNRFFQILFEAAVKMAQEGTALAGLNFWSFSGEGDSWAPESTWLPGDPFTGDPPHEKQGWYSVHFGDHDTLDLIETYARMIQNRD